MPDLANPASADLNISDWRLLKMVKMVYKKNGDSSISELTYLKIGKFEIHYFFKSFLQSRKSQNLIFKIFRTSQRRWQKQPTDVFCNCQGAKIRHFMSDGQSLKNVYGGQMEKFLVLSMAFSSMFYVKNIS